MEQKALFKGMGLNEDGTTNDSFVHTRRMTSYLDNSGQKNINGRASIKPYGAKNDNDEDSDDSDWGLEDPSTADTYTCPGGRISRSIAKKAVPFDKADPMNRMSLATLDNEHNYLPRVNLGIEPEGRSSCFACFGFFSKKKKETRIKVRHRELYSCAKYISMCCYYS